MKKIIAMMLALCMVFALCACGGSSSAPAAPAASEAPAEPVAAEYTLGMGIITSLDSTADAAAQVDATAAVVVLDAEGKIVACRIDAAQNKMACEAGEVDAEATFLTKAEKQFDYNMVAYSEATLEWFEQAANFQEYVVGMTAAEVGAIETRVRDDSEPHPGYVVAADEELFASCSIQITSFIDAVVKACNDEQAKTFATADEFTLGIAINSEASSSVAATAEEDGLVAMYSEFAGAAVAADGTILAVVTDAIQPKITIDADGAIVDTAFKATKRELKSDYNMVAYSEATLEWFEQAANFTDYVVGMTAADVLAIETRVRDDSEPHPGYVVAADEELFASCSISIPGLQEIVAKSVNNAY